MSKKLLLADDSITIQKVIGITFANEDYELTIVDNGDAALEKAKASRPDLVLADVYMPGKNGYELCGEIKNNPSFKGVPVLLLTGTFEPFDEDRARSVGADDWIAKPFESQALIDKVEKLLSQPSKAVPAAPATKTPSAPAPAKPPASPPQAAGKAPIAVAAAAAQPKPAGPKPEVDLWGEMAEADLEMDETPLEVDEALFEEPLAAEEEAFELEGPDAGAEEDIWGSFSLEEEAPKAQAAPEENPDDLWGSLGDELSSMGGATPSAQAPPKAKPAVSKPLPAVAAPPEILEEEILPLEEGDILEEEELAETPAVLGGEEFSFDEEPFAPSREPQAAVDEFSFDEETAELGGAESFEEPSAFDSGDFDFGSEQGEWGGGEEEAEAGAFYGEMEEDLLTTPAEAAQLAPPRAAEPALSAAVAEERVGTLSEEELSRVVERVAGKLLEKIAWEVVPELAENLIKDEIRKLKANSK